jgi:hypothetical protein
VEMLRNRLDSTMGQSEAIRGRAAGNTATEAAIANDNASIRIQLLQRHWRRGVREALGKVCWYLFNSPAIVLDVAMEDPLSGEEIDGVFLGGPQAGQEDMDWTQYHLSIEPLSMQRVDPQKQAAIAQMALDVAMAIAPMIPQFPWIKWATLLDQLGEANNIEGFADMVLDQDALAQAQLLGMVAPIVGGATPRPAAPPMLPGNANPRIGQEIGQRAMMRQPGMMAPMGMPMQGGQPMGPAAGVGMMA